MHVVVKASELQIPNHRRDSINRPLHYQELICGISFDTVSSGKFARYRLNPVHETP